MIKVLHGFKCLITLCLFFMSYPLAFILYGRRKYWLVSEVNFDARDNGYHFFKYLNKYQKQINSVYVISKKNVRYGQMKEIGNVVEPNSYRHMLLFIAAKVKASTLVHGCSPSGYITKFYLLKHHGTGINVALKHGIFKNLHPNYFKENAHLDLICCGAKPEYEFINSNFGYQNGVAQYTGLARFDELHNNTVEKEILIMPTWRRWLDGVTTFDEFKKSDFYVRWIELMSNKQFLKKCEDKGYKINFYVHQKIERFVDDIHLDNNINIISADRGDNIQSHLKSASLLITDFSSVFFDFAYMKKPSIYYQFDEEQYYANHYIKAYFDYRKNGFGPVCLDCTSVVSEVIKSLNCACDIQEQYKIRVEEFFLLYDNQNCERIFKCISKLLDECKNDK